MTAFRIPLILSLVFLLLLAFTAGCKNSGEATYDSTFMDYSYQRVPYRFSQPDHETSLHGDLREISALAVVDDNTLAAVNDEEGRVYLLNAADGTVTRKIKFAKSGDYEAIEVVGNQVYVLKSNGDLYMFRISDEDQVEAEEVKTAFSSRNDTEGLTFHQGYLLIACKASGDIDGNKTRGKAVYKYYIQTSKTVTEELVDIEKKELEKFVENRNYFNKIRDFDPSAIAVHPKTSDLYVLSADQVLVVFGPDNKLKEVVKLDPSIYKQPEGLCFMADGTMYIASEGAGARGRLFKLSYNAAAN